MVNKVMIHGNTLQDCVFRMLVTLICVVTMVGCADDGGGSGSEATGMVALSWSFECPEEGKNAFIAQVYDSSNTYLTYGGPWECSAGSGTVHDVPTGSNHKLVLFAEESTGEFLYRGEKRAVDVVENVTTEVGDLDLLSFVASLEEPEDNEMVGKEFLLRWNYVAGAARYIVQIDSNTDFNDPIIVESVSGPPYSPEALESGGNYYWKVTCADIYDNQGAASEIWRFIVPAPVAMIAYPENEDVFNVPQEITFSGEAIDDAEGALQDEALVWTSDRDGLIGYGESVEYFGLSVGMHRITLTATNSSGYSESDTITIYIVPEE